MLALAATAVTAALLLLLCRNDPKRRRAARLAGEGHAPRTRRALVAAALLPGAACLALGDSASFMIWIGAAAVAGWLTTMVASGPART